MSAVDRKESQSAVSGLWRTLNGLVRGLGREGGGRDRRGHRTPRPASLIDKTGHLGSYKWIRRTCDNGAESPSPGHPGSLYIARLGLGH